MSNQYTFPDGTTIDFGNRDPQECLDDYVKWRARGADTSAQPNTESDKSIDTIDEIFAPLIDSPSLTLTTTYWNDAKDQIYSLLMDVTGEDEFPPDQDEWYGEDEAKIIGRDELRAEQRQKLNQLFNKGHN